MPGDNNSDVDFSERQNIFDEKDATSGPAPPRQFTVAGIVSTKQRRLEDHVIEEVPPSYTSNSNKEQLCLEYVAHFRKQFDTLMDSLDIRRPPLYLCPPNERGVPKFVCTTIRPTLLPFLDLYDVDKLAAFVSGLIEYEPLADPCAPPACLPSPTAVVAWQAGDSFDMATLLVSFLVGAGYDAYVVHGIAPKWVCLLDQSHTLCPFLDATTTTPATGVPRNSIAQSVATSTMTSSSSSKGDDAKFMSSKFVALMEAKEEARRQEVAALQDWTKHMDNEDDDEDELDGKRVHAWVLVRAGRRDGMLVLNSQSDDTHDVAVSEHVFIEPSTSRKYPVGQSPYRQIQAVWNHQNYWVNMQSQRDIGVSQTLFDLANATDWEFVFLSTNDRRAVDGNGGLNEPKHDDLDVVCTCCSLWLSVFVARGGRGDNNNNGGLDDGNDDANDHDENILDLPPSWATKLIVERKTYKRRFVNDGQRTTLYRKAKLEEFAENSHAQGLVMRITQYRNLARTLPIQVREIFKNRKDKLHLRIRYPLDGKFEEHFLPGRVPEALSMRTEWSGFRRDLSFYTSARMDGLVKREETIHKRIAESYEGRDDFLVARSVSLTEDKDVVETKASGGTLLSPFVLPGGATGELIVLKMAEKLERNSLKEADDDARKRTYNVREGTIRVQYHYAEGKITSGARVYHKAPNTPVDVFQVDPMATRPKESILERELQGVIQMEKECYNSIRHSDVETQEILKYRRREEASIQLETSIFDAQDDESKLDPLDDQRKQGKDAKANMDYLSPFLQSVHHSAGRPLAKDEAHTVRDSCLKNLKERLLERANIIQTRLDKENSALAKKQAAFQRSQREHDQGTDEEFERFCSETMFRIQILEQRLTRHEETALQKYAELDQRLHNDPRLSVLHQ
ncbi:Aste57867_121 [Aphanomyces stellatus]|uniref:Aste57867_121 protein n=1 Tax=Aphanomyces stellatus TaxID=120398 RepID=A0A485K292_9STRA|nr:hypothetical protein As57867_000121 [Aphanomyces stellatus]VFT77347.1 Aste57867_121 [Aphanomyces stellatus]